MDQQDIVDELASLRAEVSRLREERIPAVDRSSRRRDRRLTVAYVAAAALAVGLAGVGSASALDGSDTVFSDDIVDGTVTSLDVAKNSLITSDIKDNSVAGRDIQDGALGTADIADESIHGVDILNGTVLGVDVADGVLTGVDIADGTITGADIDLFNDGRCNLETLLGTALINADPAVPSTFTTDWIAYPHSCSGDAVMVRRLGTGVYNVDFGFSNPARLAVVTQNTSNGAQPSAVISVESLNSGLFYVQTRVNGSYADVDFTIMAF